MKTIKARVVNGRLLVDEPTKFPEGTELPLALADEDDEMSEEERAALHAALQASWTSACAGLDRPAEELVKRLRASE